MLLNAELTDKTGPYYF